MFLTINHCKTSLGEKKKQKRGKICLKNKGIAEKFYDFICDFNLEKTQYDKKTKSNLGCASHPLEYVVSWLLKQINAFQKGNKMFGY